MLVYGYRGCYSWVVPEAGSSPFTFGKNVLIELGRSRGRTVGSLWFSASASPTFPVGVHCRVGSCEL